MLYMKNTTPTQIKKTIEKIKQELQTIQQMRPGSLTRQYHNPKDKTGAYYQLSYTHKMRSRTEYVRPEYVEQLRKQINESKRFKELVEKWIELGIQHSKMQIDRAKKDR
jgi:hypothetical protein